MNNIDALENLALSLGCTAERGVPMKNYTTFKIGGPAELFLVPETAQQTARLVKFCRENGIPAFVLGKGSNILVSDEGIKGAVIFTGRLCGISLVDECTVYAQSGLSLASSAILLSGIRSPASNLLSVYRVRSAARCS